MALRTKVIVTAGATREYIDPIRFLTNRSTGRMGIAFAEAAFEAGFEVTLVKTASVIEEAPPGVRTLEVETAEEMLAAVRSLEEEADCLIMAAAVSDLAPEEFSRQKIKKKDRITLSFRKTPDILAQAGRNRSLIKVGFALETEDLRENAERKLKEKGLALIVANINAPGNDPFGEGRKDFVLLTDKGEEIHFKAVTKKELAREVLGRISGLCGEIK